MNINETLYNKVDTFGFDYSCYPYDIKAFLTGKHGFLERQKAAEKITEEILREHGKEELIGCLVELAKVETGIRELEPRARDHVVHALLTFVLGIFINETYVKENNGIPVNSFQWKLVACPPKRSPVVMLDWNYKKGGKSWSRNRILRSRSSTSCAKLRSC